MKLPFKSLPALALAAFVLSPLAQAQELTVMTSGGFTAAYKSLATPKTPATP